MPQCKLRLVLVLVLALLPVAKAGARPPRYAAMLASGQRVEGNSLHDWHEPQAKPRLDGQALLDPSNPMRWLRDRTLRLAELPLAFVELHTGDRLPGTVVDARSGQEATWDPLPAHLVVQPAITLSPPGKPSATELRVVTSFVRRIVWQRRSRQTYVPNTVFYRDGRSLAFRAIRFGSGHLNVLLAGENRKISWSDLAEVHLGETNSWQAYFDDLAAICPNGQVRLMQIETTAGLVATTSLDRFVPRFDGNAKESDRWVHGIQPAWSLDLLWIPCREIVFRRSFAPHEVPLSRIAPQSRVSRSALGGSARAMQTNRSVLSTPLRSAGQDFGWGLGVQSCSELTFELPAGVKSLRTWAAIDQASGKGGCLKFRLLANDAKGPVLWESPLLVGSEQVIDSGVIALTGPAGGQKAIVLYVDPATSGRPAGADPLDIRDNADWLDPILELDPAVVKAEIAKRLPQQVAAWRDWKVRLASLPGLSANGELETVSTRDSRHLLSAFQAAVSVRGQALVLSRELTVGPDDHWLVIAAARIGGRPPEPKLEVRIGGEGVVEQPLADRPNDPNDLRPLTIPLAAYQRPQGAQIEVEIRQLPVPDGPPVHWRAIQVVDQLPTLYRVFEERGQLAAVDAGPGSAAIVDDDRHFGTRSLRITPPGSFRLPLPQSVAIRERPQWGEYRFIRFAIRKQGGGQAAVEFETVEPRIEPARYDAGAGKPAFGKALRVWNDKLGKDWIVITRDLYADFGAIELRGLTFSCLAGEQANFDHIYLARSHDDFNSIPAAPSPDQTNEKARLELARQVVERVMPAMLAIQLPDGRTAGGVLIRREGEILTAGHAVAGAFQEAAVTLSDGRIVRAVRLGISRELDLGLLKIADKGEWPVVPIWDRREAELNQSYVALTWPAQFAAGVKPELAAVDLRRAFRNTLWTNRDRADWSPGGALVHRNGQLIGIHQRRSNFGGFLYARLFTGELEPYLQKMRGGEIWGAWPAGSQPELGIIGIAQADGLQLSQVTGPAAKAGLQVGDLLLKLEGKPIASSDDLEILLAEKDPGVEVTLEFRRASAMRQAKAILAPRGN